MNSVNSITRRAFALGAAAFAAAGRVLSAPEASSGAGADGIRVRFLGSGAAGWDPKWLDANPHTRRPSSVLLDGRVLIDFIPTGFDMLPEGCRPEVLFQTHSHGDHYNPAAAVKSGVRRVYVQESWASAAREEIAAAAKRLSLPPPEVVALPFAKSGSFVAEPKPLTAIIMEATNGDSDADFRMFVHSSVQTVARTVEVLRQNGRYAPPPGQCAYITHLGLKYRDWPSDKIDAELPSGIRSAHDGFETTFC